MALGTLRRTQGEALCEVQATMLQRKGTAAACASAKQARPEMPPQPSWWLPHLLVKNRNCGPLLGLLPQAEPPNRCIAVRACLCRFASVQLARPSQHSLQHKRAKCSGQRQWSSKLLQIPGDGIAWFTGDYGRQNRMRSMSLECLWRCAAEEWSHGRQGMLMPRYSCIALCSVQRGCSSACAPTPAFTRKHTSPSPALPSTCDARSAARVMLWSQ